MDLEHPGPDPVRRHLLRNISQAGMSMTKTALPSVGRRVLVTGAAGFLGSHLCERLVGFGAAVVGVDNLCTGRLANLARLDGHPRFELRLQDVTQPVELVGDVDWIFHLVSPAAPRDYLRLPVETLSAGAIGTFNLLKLAAEKGSRFVLASTSEVYGDPGEHPQRESYNGNVNPVGPRSVHDEAKRFAEALTAAYRRERRADGAIVRIFNTYGPRMRPDDGRAVPQFIRQARDGLPLTVTGDGSQTRSLCFVSDLVDGLPAVAAHDNAGPVNLGNPQEISMLALARTIRQMCGSTSPIEFVARPMDDPARRRPDVSMARCVLGWSPRVNLGDGLRRTIAAMGPRASSAAIASGGPVVRP